MVRRTKAVYPRLPGLGDEDVTLPTGDKKYVGLQFSCMTWRRKCHSLRKLFYFDEHESSVLTLKSAV